jgi:myo-inositol 2-dehydrogenase/D-chiro-inositol 1-dehydrogenase
LNHIKIGILGLGRIGRIHLENLCTKWEGVEVLGAMAPSLEGQSIAHRYKVPLVTSDADAVISHPDIDAIVICSPTSSHADYVIKAARAGKAIFCEKPMDLSLDRVRATLNIVRESKVPLMMAFNQRMDPNFAEAKAHILHGKAGRLHTIHIISRDPGPPPISYIKESGGLFMDMTIHDFDMARYLTGKEVVEVFAKGYNLIDPEIGMAGDIDTGIVVLTFEDQTTAIIENSRKAVYGYDQRLEVFGSSGMIRVDNPLKTTMASYDAGGTHLSTHPVFFMDRYIISYQREMEAFITALKNNQPMPVTGEDGLKAMIIAQAANLSMAQNRSVRIDEL